MDLAEARRDVDEYVAETLAEYQFSHVTESKIIRDPVYGFQRFYPHEIAIIDSPILQRLRGVHQTALSYLVYPSANHTRFEHSLGVATKAEQLALALQSAPSRPDVSATRVLELRLAGLLHDSGHGLFSHLTESILSQRHPELIHAIKSSDDFPEKTHLGEALSALIVRSPAFGDLIARVKTSYATHEGLRDVTTDRIANLILGRTANPEEQYLADIISGPFDADKLDYLGRDCHFTGIRAEVDWERITHALDVHTSNGTIYLAVRQPAVPHLEQILFSKMMLFSAVYHHHKIRTLEQMVQAVFEVAHERSTDLNNPLFALARLSDMWRLSEAAFFVLAKHESVVSDRVKAILDRRLMQRALLLNITTIKKDPENVESYLQFQKLFAAPGSPQTARLLARAVHQQLPAEVRKRIGEHEIRFDFPRSPSLSDDAEQCNVLVGPGDARTLRAFFPTEDWVASYADNKLSSHVFAAGDQETRAAVADAAESVLSDLFRLQIDKTARHALK
ncbi:MAG: HD domain-containing protein [Chloroflexi bacterium]|nr:HD domain-containing protein [Chloroflexota bacterium]